MTPLKISTTPEKWKTILFESLKHSSGQLAIGNCFNPLIASIGYEDARTSQEAEKRWTESLKLAGLSLSIKEEVAVLPIVAALNSLYYQYLDYLTENILIDINLNVAIKYGRNFHEFYDLLKLFDIPVSNFLEFKGIFSSCIWLVSERKHSDLPFVESYRHSSYVIPQHYLSSEEIEKDWKAIKTLAVGDTGTITDYGANHPSTIIKKWFDGLDSIETRNIDKIRRPNPFRELLLGSIYPAFEDDMQLCVDSIIFREEWNKIQHKETKSEKIEGADEKLPVEEKDKSTMTNVSSSDGKNFSYDSSERIGPFGEKMPPKIMKQPNLMSDPEKELWKQYFGNFAGTPAQKVALIENETKHLGYWKDLNRAELVGIRSTPESMARYSRLKPAWAKKKLREKPVK